jgi:glycosyltransferase involved in cell wall biosynthesis
MLNSRVWVIIPAYNEEKNIARVLEDLKKITVNILVVDDGSSDSTPEICRDHGVFCISHKINRDQGAALQTGNEAALDLGAEVIVHFDADGQMKSEEIIDMVGPILKKEADITLGSRFINNKTKMPWTKRYLILKPAILFNWVFTGIKLSDAHNGFRALSAEAAKKINIRQDGKSHASEILEQIYEHKLKWQEVPVEIIYNEYGQGFAGGLKIIKSLLLSRILK